MYRYNNQNRFNHIMRSNRFRPLWIIAALIVAAFLIYRFVGVGGLNEGNFENQRNARIRSEMQHAVNQTISLSRLGATSTSGALGKIRQYVHGVEVLNELNISMYGEVGRMYDQLVFDNIYAHIDTYETKLSSGQKVNDTLTLLTEAINQMNDLTNSKVLGQ